MSVQKPDEWPRSLDEAVVSLLSLIDSKATTEMLRAPEVTEYRRGYSECATGLMNSREMDEVKGWLEASGWQRPRSGWSKGEETT